MRSLTFVYFKDKSWQVWEIESYVVDKCLYSLRVYESLHISIKHLLRLGKSLVFNYEGFLTLKHSKNPS